MRLTEKRKQLLFDYLINVLGIRETEEQLMNRLLTWNRMKIPGSKCQCCGASLMLIRKDDPRNPLGYFVGCSNYPRCDGSDIIAWVGKGLKMRPIVEVHTRPATHEDLDKTPQVWEHLLKVIKEQKSKIYH